MDWCVLERRKSRIVCLRGCAVILGEHQLTNNNFPSKVLSGRKLYLSTDGADSHRFFV